MSCNFYLLGSFAIKDNLGRVVTPKSQKTCAMLAMLLLSPRATRTRVWLRDKLWSNRGEEQGASSLRQALLDARKSFQHLSLDIINSDKKSISLNLDNISIDIDSVFKSRIADLTGRNSTVIALREDLLEGIDIRDPEFEDWLAIERQAWAQRVASFLSIESPPQNEKTLTCEAGQKVMSTIVVIRLDLPDSYRNSNLFNDYIRMLQDESDTNGGRIFKIQSRHVLLEFGRPHDAVRYAISIVKHLNNKMQRQELKNSIDFGIGINSGFVYQNGSNLYGSECDIALEASNKSTEKKILITNASIISVQGKLSCRFIEDTQFKIKDISDSIRLSKVIENTEPQAASFGGLLGPSALSYSTTCPSIGVLPFRVSDASVKEYMSEGLADDIILALSSNHWLSVISRNSSFSYTYDPKDPSPEINELNLDYIVCGVVKVLNSVLKITVTLERVESKHILWLESFSVDISEIMSLQAAITSKITAQLLQELGKHEQVRAYQSNIDDLTTWQLVHRGHWHMARRTSTGVTKAKHFYERALQLDENQSEALIALAWWYFWKAWSEHGINDTEKDLERSSAFCRKALLIDQTDGRIHAFLGVIAIMKVQPSQAIRYFDEAIRLNPSDSLAYSSRGSANLMKGNAHLAPKDICNALALNPSDYYRFHKLAELAAAYYFSGDYDKSIEAAESSSFLAPRYWYARLIMLASLLDRNAPGDSLRASKEKSAILKQKINVSEKNIRAIPYEDRTCIDRLVSLYSECEL